MKFFHQSLKIFELMMWLKVKTPIFINQHNAAVTAFNRNQRVQSSGLLPTSWIVMLHSLSVIFINFYFSGTIFKYITFGKFTLFLLKPHKKGWNLSIITSNYFFSLEVTFFPKIMRKAFSQKEKKYKISF